MTGSAQIIRGNALDLPLADASVDLICTSPPYFGLRSYTDAGEHYAGQIGAEATPTEFVDALIQATREMVRCLKPSGSIWINLGDSYAGAAPGPQGKAGQRADRASANEPSRAAVARGGDHVRAKSLRGVPWRYALRCIDDLGLILRAEVIWAKPNGLPESVTDRVRRSHEQWFHFTKEPRYFSAVDEIREQHSAHSLRYEANGRGAKYQTDAVDARRGVQGFGGNGNPAHSLNPLGKLPGSVWTIDGGESLTRSVLNAVAAGGITPDEGERILLWTQDGSWSTLLNQTAAARSGKGGKTAGDTPKSPSVEVSSSSSIASPTNFSSDPSPQGSPSTTSVATHPASDRTTLNQSPFAKTFAAPTPSGQPADMDTAWPTPTSTSPPPVSTTRNAGRASSPESDAGESVWVVPTQPLKVPAELGIDHFAAFSMEFPRRIIQGWSPAGVCSACGQGRRPVGTREHVVEDMYPDAAVPGLNNRNRTEYRGRRSVTVTLTGYACACTEGTYEWESPNGVPHLVIRGLCATCGNGPHPLPPTTPSTVLDPFGGTGTTALVAKALGRHGISVDMSADYCRLAEWRTTDRGQLAAAMQVEKPAAVHPDQLDLFGGAA